MAALALRWPGGGDASGSRLSVCGRGPGNGRAGDSRCWVAVSGPGSGRSISIRSSGGDGPRQRRVASLFSEEEAIGGEYGEGFASFRPRGPLHVDVDFLNDRMRERGLQRIRYAMRPDEAFGLIYSWDNVVADTQALKMRAWSALAKEEGQEESLKAVLRRQILGTSAEYVFRQVLRWGRSPKEVERLSARLAELYAAELGRVEVPMDGLRDWLEALGTAGVPCALAAPLDRLSLISILERMGLRRYFRSVVAKEDGMESIAHRFLSAAVKLDRAPCKCVVFEDDPRGIAAAHNCSMKAVALIGSHPAYELKQADITVGSFTELSVINLRRLFANKGAEFMDLQKQPEEKLPCKRKLVNDTLF